MRTNEYGERLPEEQLKDEKFADAVDQSAPMNCVDGKRLHDRALFAGTS